MPNIDPRLAEQITPDQLNTLIAHGFDLTDDNGHYVITDPEIRKVRKSKGAGRWSGGNFLVVLHDAMAAQAAFRKVREDRAAGASEKTAPRSAKAEKQAAQSEPETAPIGETPVPDTGPGTEPEPEVAKQTAEKSSPHATRYRLIEPVDELTPPTEISGAVLDDSGKRVRPSRKAREKKERRPNFYERLAYYMIDNPTMTREQLVAASGENVSVCLYMVRAWKGIAAAMQKRGLNFPDRGPSSES